MKGAYVLLVYLDEEKTVRVGALGGIRFPRGYYTYTGSSMTNLEKRVARHFRKTKPLKWHIDHLLASAKVLRAELFPSDVRKECEINEVVLSQGGSVPAKGFGSSDCSCETHLVYFGEAYPHFEYPHERQTMHPPS